jgi:hypothetical protein
VKIRKVKTSTLIIALTVGLLFSLFMGVTGISMGLGSLFPQLNLVAQPFVCPNGQMTYTQHVTEIGADTYTTADWFCVPKQSGAQTELESNTVFLIAGPFYGLILFVVLLGVTYVYWNSSIGPAKNDGLRLW